MMKFRDALDRLCRERGVQYSELARRVGVTKSYIGQLVHGHSKPPPAERCAQLAEALELGREDRERLLDLAVRERARSEALGKIEELDDGLAALHAAAATLLVECVGALPWGAGGPEPPGHDSLLADVRALVLSGRPGARAAALTRLDEASPVELASALTALGTAVAALRSS